MMGGITIKNKVQDIRDQKEGTCFFYQQKPYQLIRKKRIRRKAFVGTHYICSCKDGTEAILLGGTEVYMIQKELFDLIEMSHAGSE